MPLMPLPPDLEAPLSPPMGPFVPDGTTWNPYDNSDALLSNGNLTATFGVTNNTFHSIRSTSFRTSGKYMFVTQIGIRDQVGGWIIGVGSGQAPLDKSCGATHNSAGAQFIGNTNRIITYNPYSTVYNLSSSERDKIATCVDIDLGLIWWSSITQRSGWTNNSTGDFSGDPSISFGGTELGFDTSLGTYIMGSGYYGVLQADALILNPQCFGYTELIPNLFTSWDPLTIGFTVMEPC